MFSNLTKEIIYYSVIPVAILFVIILLLFIGKKKDNNIYKYNYFIKVLLLIIIGLVLPLITGYSIWIYERFTNKGILSSNILYMLLLGILIVSLIVLFVYICTKIVKGIDREKVFLEEEKSFE